MKHPTPAFDSMCDWSVVDNYSLNQYQSLLNDYLCHVNIPSVANLDNVSNAIIDEYYTFILSCIKTGSQGAIPTRVKTWSDKIVPGWNDFVIEKHKAARDAFFQWAYMSKPRSGLEYTLMVKTRSTFKLALRFCKQNEEVVRTDAFATCLASKDYRSFWSSIHKQSNAKSTIHANVIDGCTGDGDVCRNVAKALSAVVQFGA